MSGLRSLRRRTALAASSRGYLAFAHPSFKPLARASGFSCPNKLPGLQIPYLFGVPPAIGLCSPTKLNGSDHILMCLAAYSARLSWSPFLCGYPFPPNTHCSSSLVAIYLGILPDRDSTGRKRGLAAGMKAHRYHISTQMSVLCCHSSRSRMIPSILSLHSDWPCSVTQRGSRPRRDHRPLPACCKPQGCMLPACHVPCPTGGAQWAALQEYPDLWRRHAALVRYHSCLSAFAL